MITSARCPSFDAENKMLLQTVIAIKIAMHSRWYKDAESIKINYATVVLPFDESFHAKEKCL